ncbi:hypothetical protein [Lysobacter sp. HA35]
MKSFLAAALLLSGTPALAITPPEIEHSVQAVGAARTVKAIWNSEADTRRLLAGVASAKPAWLRVGMLLAAAADAGASEELDDAFSSALLVAPYRVLPLVRSGWWPPGAQLCHFEPDSELPGGSAAYARRLAAALDRQRTRSGNALRAECRRGIKTTISASAGAGT